MTYLKLVKSSEHTLIQKVEFSSVSKTGGKDAVFVMRYWRGSRLLSKWFADATSLYSDF